MLSGFRAPDFNEPLDADERIARAPEDGSVRGLFLQIVADELAARGKPPLGARQYSGFARYPLREYMKLVVAAAPLLHPGLPLREGLRRIGRAVYPAFKDTMAGSAIFAFAGRDFARVAGLAQKAYGVAVAPGEVSVREPGPRHVVVELRQIYNFPDCLQVGVWEGAMGVCGAEGQVQIKVHSVCDVDFEIQWA